MPRHVQQPEPPLNPEKEEEDSSSPHFDLLKLQHVPSEESTVPTPKIAHKLNRFEESSNSSNKDLRNKRTADKSVWRSNRKCALLGNVSNQRHTIIASCQPIDEQQN